MLTSNFSSILLSQQNEVAILLPANATNKYHKNLNRFEWYYIAYVYILLISNFDFAQYHNVKLCIFLNYYVYNVFNYIIEN